MDDRGDVLVEHRRRVAEGDGAGLEPGRLEPFVPHREARLHVLEPLAGAAEADPAVPECQQVLDRGPDAVGVLGLQPRKRAR